MQLAAASVLAVLTGFPGPPPLSPPHLVVLEPLLDHDTEAQDDGNRDECGDLQLVRPSDRVRVSVVSEATGG